MLNTLKKKRQQLLIQFLIFISAAFVLLIATGLTNLDTTTKMSIMLLIMIILAFLIWPIRPKMFFYHQQISYLKMKDTQIKPKKSKYKIPSSDFVNSLLSKGYVSSIDYGEFIIYHQLNNQSTNFKYKKGLLEIIVLIKNEATRFDSEDIVKGINTLEKELQKNKKRFSNYIILQLRQNKNLSKNIIHEADQVTFDKQFRHHITKINIVYTPSSEKLYYLGSNKYYPSIFYQYALDIISTNFIS